MRNLNRIFFLLLAFLLLTPNPSQAQLYCSDLFTESSKNSISDAYKKLGIDLADFSENSTQVLKNAHPALTSPKAPSYEEIMAVPFSNWPHIHQQLNANHPFARVESFKSVLSFFKFMKEDADYIFVGNGYYISYLMAKSIFSGTALEHRIKFLPFSRGLAAKAAINFRPFATFFKDSQLGEGKRKIVIIDSVSPDENPNGHSLIRTSMAIRNYLISVGWTHRESLDSIITMGTPEEPGYQSYRFKSLTDYSEKIRSIDETNYDRTTFPYFDPGLNWGQAPFIQSYSHEGNQYYWNGKYNTLDKYDVPMGESDVRPNLVRYTPEELTLYLTERAELAALYKEIINYGKSHKPNLAEEINRIVSEHH